jgi:hypothetical protein
MTKTALELAFATCDTFCEGLKVDEFTVTDLGGDVFALTCSEYQLVFDAKGVLLKIWQISGEKPHQTFTEVGWKRPPRVLAKEILASAR